MSMTVKVMFAISGVAYVAGIAAIVVGIRYGHMVHYCTGAFALLAATFNLFSAFDVLLMEQRKLRRIAEIQAVLNGRRSTR